jgi:V/A-type H+-transporting ATPase subunit I
MISKMKKLTFLVYHKEYEPFLERLRQLGVVHIAERQRGEPDEDLQRHVQTRATYKALMLQMMALADNQPDETANPAVTGEAVKAGYDAIQQRIAELRQRVPALLKQEAQLAPWGDFDRSLLDRLEEAGWGVHFYLCPEKDYNPEWEEQYQAVRVKEDGHNIYFVTLSAHQPQLGIEPLRLPDAGLSELANQRHQAEDELAAAEAELKAYCKANYRSLEQADKHLQDDIDLLKVKLNSEAMAEGSVVLLEGWIPAEEEQKVVDFLQETGTYYEMRAATRQDNAPIKFKNNAFVRMYEVLTKMYGMPDYAEFDPTPIVAPFFTLFFAFCMGDAGYGLALILLGFFLKKKLGKDMAGMMNLVITLGVGTTVLGAILGTFFGVSLTDINLPDSVTQFMITGKIGDTSYDKQMLLALLIGVVHLCIAMTVKAISQTVRFGFKESLSAWGWLLLVVGFVCTGGLSFFEVISADVTKWSFIVIGAVAAIGIYLLNDIHRNVLVNVGAGLWDTYNMATGLLGDVLSYIRLYALGLAGAMLGGVFNTLAFMVYDGAGPALGWLFCGLILVFGHTLNIAMSCLSAFVHPLRLTFVEYFKNSGYDGKGEEYKPFSVTK